eukprot:Nitzschia sp. Nitz4//scaffold42_size132992//33374//36964//NITZ4_003386-RA/size132992-processed-gene-0.6-mRNA-1//1//CDS//3329551679//2029//frame0
MDTEIKDKGTVDSPESTFSNGSAGHPKAMHAIAVIRKHRDDTTTSNPESSSPSIKEDTMESLDSLVLPTLNESRNDDLLSTVPSVDVLQGDDHCEVTLKSSPAQYENYDDDEDDDEPSGSDSSPDLNIDNMSVESIAKRTEQIIQEAESETMKWRSSRSHASSVSMVEDPRKREILQRALATAAQHRLHQRGTTTPPPTAQTPPPTAAATPPVQGLTTDAAPTTTSQSPETPQLEGAASQESTLTTPPLLATPPLQPPAAPAPVTTTPQDFTPTIDTALPELSTASQPNSCLSPADTLASIEDLETALGRLPTRFSAQNTDISREKALRRIDGIASPMIPTVPHSPVSSFAAHSAASLQFVEEDDVSIVSTISGGLRNDITATESNVSQPLKTVKRVKTVVIKTMEPQKEEAPTPNTGGWFSFLWGSQQNEKENEKEDADNLDYQSFMPMACGRERRSHQEERPQVASSLVRVASRDTPYGYAEAVNAQEQYVDPRMPEWIDNQFSEREELPGDGSYRLGESKTVIVHELIRGSWTWCTAWSPDGKRLAIGTENHHLAIVDTYSSAVWRIKHDKRVGGDARTGDVRHSIRSIAWGDHFIAIGGVGNSVSILASIDPYPVLHTIPHTGFVGSMHWLKGTNTLLIGSRNGKATIVKVWAQDKQPGTRSMHLHQDIQSTVVHTIDKERAWINAVKFSPGGTALVVGDSLGILGVYSYKDPHGSPVVVTNIANFKLEDSILDVEWSPDGRWLYAGGEDFVVTVIDTQWWEAVHRIKRDRWVQFISSSNGGSHVAIGGVSSEVSVLDVDRGWDTAINISLKGLVPLSAEWHPRDQYLVLTGQNNSIHAVETTNARYVSGHFLRSVSPILAIEFSPDGRFAAIGNEAGVITIFKLSGTTFITTYELVLEGSGSLSIQWSLNGSFVAIVAGSTVVIIARSGTVPSSAPPSASGFHIAQVIRDFGMAHAVAIAPKSRFLAVSGKGKTWILDAAHDFDTVLELESQGKALANSWSPDGCWFATIGKQQNLLVYDTSTENPKDWKVVFSVQTKKPGLALAWGPAMIGGLQYCAYGGEDKKVYIMEIRTSERTWETVLGIPRDGVIHDLDWNNEGLVAAAVGNGTVTVMDLSYLQSGWAVNEMDYNWQRQALTCFTEIRRNRGANAMKCVRWIPSAPGSDSLLAIGGTDGEVEIIDLTDRQRCSGFT